MERDSDSLLKFDQASARQGKVDRKSAVDTQSMRIFGQF